MSNDAHDQAIHGEQAPQTAQRNSQQPQAFFRPKPDGNVDPAGEAGWYLERERERRGLSVQTVSRAIGVHPQHVRAIELGMLENLPERGQALKMIGAYARFLGFDPQPLVEHFAACLPQKATASSQRAPQASAAARIIPFPLIERLRDAARTPAGMGASALAVVLLFGGLAWGVWPAGDAKAPRQQVVAEAEGTSEPTQVAQQPAPADAIARQDTRLAAQQPEAAPQEPAAAESAASREAKPADPIAALITRTIGDMDERQPAPEAVATAQRPARPVKKARALPLPPPPLPEERPARAQPANNAPTATASAADAPISPSAVRPLNQVPGEGIALRAAEQIWLRLEDDNGTPWYVGFLKTGQVLALPMDKALRLSASDVHRLEWYVNGQRMGRLGKRGADFLSEPLGALYKQSGLKAPGAKPSAG